MVSSLDALVHGPLLRSSHCFLLLTHCLFQACSVSSLDALFHCPHFRSSLLWSSLLCHLLLRFNSLSSPGVFGLQFGCVGPLPAPPVLSPLPLSPAQVLALVEADVSPLPSPSNPMGPGFPHRSASIHSLSAGNAIQQQVMVVCLAYWVLGRA